MIDMTERRVLEHRVKRAHKDSQELEKPDLVAPNNHLRPATPLQDYRATPFALRLDPGICLDL